MLRNAPRFNIFAALLLSTAACTQAPAQIDLRGQNSYNRDGGNYAANTLATSNSNSYVTGTTNASPSPYSSPSANTAPTAQVQSIGVSDLTPPSGSRAASDTSSTPATGGRTSWSSPQSTTPASSPFKPAQPGPKKADAGMTSTNGSVVASTSLAPVTTASNAPASDNVNPWTHKPRDGAASDALDESFNIRPQAKAMGAKKEQMVSEVKSVPVKEEKTANELDSIISNETASLDKKVDAAKLAKVEPAAGSPAFMWPVNGKKVISGFGPKGSGKVNDGINIASAEGEPVWASADGEVVYVGNELQGYGNMVLVKHNGNKTTSYAHLSRFTVDKYERVKQGDIIGYVGSTGGVKEPQLHFAIRDGKEPVDPLKQLNRSVASLK